MKRRGSSIPEALVTLLLGVLVVHLSFETWTGVRVIRGRAEARADVVVGLRATRHVLRRELRRARPGRDWQLWADSVAVRAFRGTGLVCPSDSADARIVVSYGGTRAPDPEKDSVLLLTGTGDAEVAALAAVTSVVPAAAAECGVAPGVDRETWVLDRPPPPGIVVARVFERGSYHLSAAAFRYRRGGSGRQPLTPEIWSPGSGWTSNGTRLGLRLQPERAGAEAGRLWEGFIARIGPP